MGQTEYQAEVGMKNPCCLKAYRNLDFAANHSYLMSN